MISYKFGGGHPAEQILDYLQRQGEATVKDLADLLGVSGTAVRDHLSALQADQMVVVRAERHGPGRPRLVYALSEKAHARFPQQTDRLITSLLRELLAREGPEKVAQLLNGVSRRLANEYSGRIAGVDIAVRLDELRRLLEQRGVPAVVPSDGDEIQLFACPYYDVAAIHPEVCSMERQMIEYMLGEQLVLKDSIREGSHHCRFVLRPGHIALTPQSSSEG
ncbi:MAG: ArsR family transcriptional regulator [Oscillochloris sp.]|nr:ArsR family transcriptional regulator [Oscillochloris sp.]